MDSILDKARDLAPDQDMNVVVLRGTLAAPPELRTFDTGSAKLRLLVTVRTFEPRRRVDVIPVILWDPPREVVDTARHHARAWVTGYVRRRFFEEAGGRRSILEVIAHHVEVDPEIAEDGGDQKEAPQEGTLAAVGAG